MSDDLEELSPRDAMEMWLTRQSTEKADETVQSYHYRIKQFVEWCEEQGITNLNDLSTRDVFAFDTECRSRNLSPSTLKNRFGTLKRYLSFCSDLNAVDENLVAAIEIPSLLKDERVNQEKLASGRAEEILEALATYRYSSREHAMFTLAWHTTVRLGALRALDVGDCFLDDDDLDRLRHYPEIGDEEFEEITDHVETPFVYFRHRENTPLKNKFEGQRPVAISDEVAEVLDAYIRVNRVPVTDDEGRAPLFSTEKGENRMSKGAVRRVFNIITQPCEFGKPCPHGRDVNKCEARQHGREARCPSARSPHRVRTGAITDHRDRGWPPEVLSERANATPEVIRQHYDHPDLLRRMQSRRPYLEGDAEVDDE
ncbi:MULTISPECIES: site-specific integrase [unclassified Haloferax]|uniref:tyrosine-type recombinase/integrase n=1 Tax=unclassified Haloferax TaxID=2625095 RepID=UPI000E2428E8|nr:MULTISPECIES: site-specific integrase [unclassified Haloferax]RDZ34486.1 integrase [Haloferax sp. Atlit-47N]RDZ34886.1 integrase [Haloferax sp. Atlit-24N]RDZ34892.1 integrase [Haloferax sp. Atlit-24N]RLM35304.1 integrase [Haloferax sp. Atlit-109R]RLM43146.1 integrase [Haloferax sp. Atlit-105R]